MGKQSSALGATGGSPTSIADMSANGEISSQVRRPSSVGSSAKACREQGNYCSDGASAAFDTSSGQLLTRALGKDERVVDNLCSTIASEVSGKARVGQVVGHSKQPRDSTGSTASSAQSTIATNYGKQRATQRAQNTIAQTPYS